MNLLDRLLGHDAWTTRQFLKLALPLTDTQLDREFDIGHRTLRRTFEHIIFNMEVWTDLMAAVPHRNAKGSSIAELIARLESVERGFARVAHDIAKQDGWDDPFTDVLDEPPTKKRFGAGVAHVITHSMHHRAQVLYMLRCSGIQPLPEGDVFSWESQTRKP